MWLVDGYPLRAGGDHLLHPDHYHPARDRLFPDRRVRVLAVRTGHIERRPGAGVGSLIGNIIWILLIGWWIAIGHLVSGITLCLTTIGIPLGLANFKIIPVSLLPLGVRIVPGSMF